MKRKNLSNMTPEEIVAHKRELQRLKTIRLAAKKSEQEKMQRANETPETRAARLELKRARSIARRRAQGIEPRRPAKPNEEKVAYKVAWARQKRQAARIELIERYGGKCVCCGVADYRWLTLHHINKDGGIERNHQRLNAATRLIHFVKQPKRDDLELLCYNCHLAGDFFGCCPHRDPTSSYFLGKDAM